MLKVQDIQYELVQPENFIDELQRYPSGDVAFDYETFNHVDGDRAVEAWDEHTFPFMFSLCLLSAPEDHIKVFRINTLSQEEKDVFEKFLTSRRVWAFNCSFEGAVTWKLLGKFIKFDDVQCLYKVSGEFINSLSLKKGTERLLKVPEWADSTWEALEVLREIVKRIQNVYVDSDKKNPWVEAFLNGDVRRVYELVETQTCAEEGQELTDTDVKFAQLLRRTRHIMTPTVLLCAVAYSQMDYKRLNLKYIPIDTVARYCAYDAYATAHNQLKLYEEHKGAYPVFLKQSWLASTMEAYGMTRNIQREGEIELHYQDELLHYMQAVLKIPEFTDMLSITYHENEINPDTGRLRKAARSRKGFEIEDHIHVDSLMTEVFGEDNGAPLKYISKKCKECSCYEDPGQYRQICRKCLALEDLKTRYWGYNATSADKLALFYDALFSSDRAKSAVAAYHIKKFIIQIDGFTEMIDGQEMAKAARLKWDNMAEIIPSAFQHIQGRFEEAKSNLAKRLGTDKFDVSTYFSKAFGIEDDDDDVVNFLDWAEAFTRLQSTIHEASTLTVAPTSGKRKKFVDIEDIRLSLKKENLEILYNALVECADMSPDVPMDEMPWEMRLVFCCKVIKKLDKALTAWVRGKVGRDRVRKCYISDSILDVPVRASDGDCYLYQVSNNPCAADTGRWKSPNHAIPRGCELSEMYQTRKDDSILVHWDYSQIEVRVIAVLAKEENLLKLFRENPKADVHRLMASRVWGKKPEEISGEERRASKAVTFGLLYGMSVESLAESHFKGNVTIARDVVNKFYDAYPNIKVWCKERHKQVDRNGYVQTLFGNKLYIESKSRGDRHRRSQNYPVQGSASNIAGYAIWNLWEYCRENNIEAIPQCFIHDSSDWDVRLKDLLKFIHATNKCAVEEISEEFGAPMKIDFEMGVNLNFTMHISNAEVSESGAKFGFTCPEVFYNQIIDRLKVGYTVETNIEKTSVETESWGNLFVTKRPYSMYLNRPINIFEGTIALTQK